jgi:hypothetical protein
VRHNLLDFGSTLGSGGVAPAEPWEGSQYLIEPRAMGTQLIGFGMRAPRGQATRFFESPSVGRFPANNTRFDPDQWKPRIPNQAFLSARADDQFWAARKLVTLSSDLLRAAVRAGQFPDPAAERFLVTALAERRDAIGRTYLTAVNPIADPALDDTGRLTFRNVAVDYFFARPPAAGYHAVWSSFDNVTGSRRVLGHSAGLDTVLVSPSPLPQTPGTFVMVAVSADDSDHATWRNPVHAYFRRHADGWQLVGFERTPD